MISFLYFIKILSGSRNCYKSTADLLQLVRKAKIREVWTYIRPYSKSSLTLNEWKFNLSFSRVSLLFLNSWRVSVIPYHVTTHLPAIQKQHWHSREAHIEPPLIECECEWAFRIQPIVFIVRIIHMQLVTKMPSTYFLANFQVLTGRLWSIIVDIVNYFNHGSI
jgi:hypothetical protein